MQLMSHEWLEHKLRPIEQGGVAVGLFSFIIENGKLFPETIIPLRGAIQVSTASAWNQSRLNEEKWFNGVHFTDFSAREE